MTETAAHEIQISVAPGVQNLTAQPWDIRSQNVATNGGTGDAEENHQPGVQVELNEQKNHDWPGRRREHRYGIDEHCREKNNCVHPHDEFPSPLPLALEKMSFRRSENVQYGKTENSPQVKPKVQKCRSEKPAITKLAKREFATSIREKWKSGLKLIKLLFSEDICNPARCRL